MSAHHTTHSTARSPIEVVLHTDKPNTNQPLVNQQLTLCWQVSRRALGKQAPAGSSLAVNLELKITNTTHHWSLIDPKGTERTTITDDHQAKPMVITQTDTLLCMESPTFSCIIAIPTNKPAELLYVRTDIFKQLNLPGGRYTPATCTLTNL